MNIRCLSCGYTIDLDDDYSDYEGQIKCYTCHALLEVKLSDGFVRSTHLYCQAGVAAETQTESPHVHSAQTLSNADRGVN